MTRDDFLRQIRISLHGKVSPEVIDESVRYYEDYIMMQVRKGENEESVLESLGDPRLLAKSIAAAKGQTSDGSGRRSDETYTYTSGEDNFTSGKPKSWEKLKRRYSELPKGLRILSMIILAVLVVTVLIFLFGALLAILPFVLIAIGVAFVVYYIRKNLKI